MAIPTKAQATAAAQRRASRLPERVDQALNANMEAGVIGATIGYGGPVAAGIVTGLVNQLEARGWTVVRDDTNQTLTIT